MSNDTTALPTYPTDYPVRGEFLLHPVLGTGDYATADGRFYTRQRHGGGIVSDGFETTDRDVDGTGFAWHADINGARRFVADRVDAEHRNRVIDYTAAVAATDEAVAKQVADMRRTAAAHGRMSGTTGAYYTENRGKRAHGEMLSVYVPRSEFRALA